MILTHYRIKRNEDAPPYADSNMTIVCDGMGGTGDFIHPDNTFSNKSVTKQFFLNLVLDSKNLSIVAAHFDSCFEDSFYKNNKIKTSSFFGSRFVSLLTLIFFINHQNLANIEHLIEKELLISIQKNLNKLYEEFKFQERQNLSSKSEDVFPTTLAATIVIGEGSRKKIISVSAGDSKAFFISKAGLQVLNIEDANDEGLLTNNINIKGRKCFLNMNKITVKEDFALISCSDGLINKSLLGNKVEAAELQNIFFNLFVDSINIEDFKNKLKKYINGSQFGGDDVSVAMLINSSSFKTFKKKLNLKAMAKKSDIIFKKYVKYYENSHLLLEEDELRRRYLFENRDLIKKFLVMDFLINENSNIKASKELLEYKKNYSKAYKLFFSNVEFRLDSLAKEFGKELDEANLTNLNLLVDHSNKINKYKVILEKNRLNFLIESPMQRIKINYIDYIKVKIFFNLKSIRKYNFHTDNLNRMLKYSNSLLFELFDIVIRKGEFTFESETKFLRENKQTRNKINKLVEDYSHNLSDDDLKEVLKNYPILNEKEIYKRKSINFKSLSNIILKQKKLYYQLIDNSRKD